MAKTKLNVTRENILQDTQRFLAMWEQAKSKLLFEEVIEESISALEKRLEIVKTKSAEWREMVQQKDKLM